jgi:hypothetical protein
MMQWLGYAQDGEDGLIGDVVAANIFDERECVFLHDLSLL